MLIPLDEDLIHKKRKKFPTLPQAGLQRGEKNKEKVLRRARQAKKEDFPHMQKKSRKKIGVKKGRNVIH